MSDEQREAVWVFPEEPNQNRGPRIALVVGLVLLVVVVAAGLALFLIPRDDAAPTASPSTAPTAAPPGAPTGAPVTPPPTPDPSVAPFRGQVQPRLDDGSTGLDMVQGKQGADAVQIVDSLQINAQNLAEQSAPDSIRAAWGDGVNAYSAKLQALRSALSAGSDPSGPLADARAALGNLRALVGL
ncbi:hypothetical protein [Microbacterium capsulatum]|uniref:Uncharacterized protein n=1 Tax=Microbacterium capsulatum TaxID=3041921 RepID=A0ABU0XJS1_9MICO|nr:hypothetical protein [Microbacterium sp. ASV81]MDQ4215395.1 hypothetical protein [Microbacterium sp. ASV81]